MKKRNVILGILLILIITLGVIFINFINHKTYNFKLPPATKIVSVNWETNSQSNLISDTEELKIIYNLFKDNHKTKQRESYNQNGENKIKITFYYEDGIATIIYLYKYKDNYYLEQLNNGVYEINESFYNNVAKFLE